VPSYRPGEVDVAKEAQRGSGDDRDGEQQAQQAQHPQPIGLSDVDGQPLHGKVANAQDRDRDEQQEQHVDAVGEVARGGGQGDEMSQHRNGGKHPAHDQDPA
jgi:hypothetical protein